MARLAEDESIAFGDGVCTNDNGRHVAECRIGVFAKLLVNGLHFTISELHDESRRTRLAADTAFHVGGGADHLKVVPCFLQQLASPGGTTGEYDALSWRNWGVIFDGWGPAQLGLLVSSV